MIVGIDLGTSTSEIAILRDGKPILLREVRGSSHGILPSVVGIGTDGLLQVGEHAAALLIPKPDFAVQEVKRDMGTERRLRLGGDEYSPQEISAMILRHLKEEAERALGERVAEAVITVPAYFTAIKREATREAGELAGLIVRRLISEPTAAALAYGLERPGVEEKILVYDLGGGTLDVTVLELSEGVLDVNASTGNPELGGKEFDERLMQFFRDECRRQTGIDVLASPRLKQRLKSAARKAKEDLSSLDSASVILDNIGLTQAGDPVDFEYRISRAKFEELVRDLVHSTRVQLDEALAVKGLTPNQIDKVLMIGGSTRIPFVRQFVSDYFGGRQLLTEISPDEAVALGAAVLAGIEARQIEPDRIVVTDVSPWTLGIAILEEVEGERQSGVFSPLIEKQSTIPRSAKQIYNTVYDWQQSVEVKVYQGDAPLCKDNVFVHSFVLDQLPPKPAGEEIEIEFSYNLSGEVDVVARHVASGREARARVRPDKTHFSYSEKAAAQDRLERIWRAGTREPLHPSQAKPQGDSFKSQQSVPAWQASPLYGRVAALMNHAEGRLAKLDPAQSAKVSKLLDVLRKALLTGEETTVKKSEEKLIDLLFELE